MKDEIPDWEWISPFEFLAMRTSMRRSFLGERRGYDDKAFCECFTLLANLVGQMDSLPPAQRDVLKITWDKYVPGVGGGPIMERRASVGAISREQQLINQANHAAMERLVKAINDRLKGLDDRVEPIDHSQVFDIPS